MARDERAIFFNIVLEDLQGNCRPFTSSMLFLCKVNHVAPCICVSVPNHEAVSASPHKTSTSIWIDYAFAFNN